MYFDSVQSVFFRLRISDKKLERVVGDTASKARDGEEASEMGFSPAHQASAKRPLFRGKFHAFKPLFCFRAQAAESGLTAQTTWGLDPERG